MPSPTMARGLLGHFLRRADPIDVCQCTSPLSVWYLTFLSLWVILVARDEGGGAWSSAGGCRSPREGRGVGRGVGGSGGYRWGARSGGTVQDTERMETGM